MLTELNQNQARPFIFRPPVSILAFASGKGGVGKTTSAINLAAALGQIGQSVMLVDTDLGLGNVDVALGINTSLGLNKVLDGSLSLEEIICQGPYGIKIVSAASGLSELSNLGSKARAHLIRSFSEYQENVDHLIVDIATGIGPDVLQFSSACQEIVAVVCDEPTSLTDAYALIKVLSREKRIKKINILANRVNSEAHGEQLFKKLVHLCFRFLDVQLEYFGCLPEDTYLKRSVRQQSSILETYPQSAYAKAIRKLAKKISVQQPERVMASGLGFFCERFI